MRYIDKQIIDSLQSAKDFFKYSWNMKGLTDFSNGDINTARDHLGRFYLFCMENEIIVPIMEKGLELIDSYIEALEQVRKDEGKRVALRKAYHTLLAQKPNLHQFGIPGTVLYSTK